LHPPWWKAIEDIRFRDGDIGVETNDDAERQANSTAPSPIATEVVSRGRSLASRRLSHRPTRQYTRWGSSPRIGCVPALPPSLSRRGLNADIRCLNRDLEHRPLALRLDQGRRPDPRVDRRYCERLKVSGHWLVESCRSNDRSGTRSLCVPNLAHLYAVLAVFRRHRCQAPRMATAHPLLAPGPRLTGPDLALSRISTSTVPYARLGCTMLSFGVLKRPLLAAGAAALATAVAIVGPALLISNAWFSESSIGAFGVVVVVVVSLLAGLLGATFTLSGPDAVERSGVLGLFVTSCPVSNVIALALLSGSVIASWFVAAVALLGVLAMAGAVAAVGVRGHLIRRTGISCPVPNAPGRSQQSSPSTAAELTNS